MPLMPRSAPIRKKRSEHRPGPNLINATIDIRGVMACGLPKESDTMLDRTSLLIIGPEIEPANARKGDRGCTHGTGLKCDVEIEIRQSLALQLAGRIANGDNFRMGRWIVQLARPITRPRDYGPIRCHDDSTDGNFTACCRRLRLAQRKRHRRTGLVRRALFCNLAVGHESVAQRSRLRGEPDCPIFNIQFSETRSTEAQ